MKNQYLSEVRINILTLPELLQNYFGTVDIYSLHRILWALSIVCLELSDIILLFFEILRCAHLCVSKCLTLLCVLLSLCVCILFLCMLFLCFFVFCVFLLFWGKSGQIEVLLCVASGLVLRQPILQIIC